MLYFGIFLVVFFLFVALSNGVTAAQAHRDGKVFRSFSYTFSSGMLVGLATTFGIYLAVYGGDLIK